ncbi:MAG: RING finger protein [Chlamydiota bacterium]
MSVSFSTPATYKRTDTCCICQDPLGRWGVVAHDGKDGEKHPMHRSCMRTWSDIKPYCPFCKISVNTKSLISWKEKTPAIIKELIINTLSATIVTLFLAVIAAPAAGLAFFATSAAGADLPIAVPAGIIAGIGSLVIVILKTSGLIKAHKAKRARKALDALHVALATSVAALGTVNTSNRESVHELQRTQIRTLTPLIIELRAAGAVEQADKVMDLLIRIVHGLNTLPLS